jgi:hypothetical protein
VGGPLARSDLAEDAAGGHAGQRTDAI